MTINFKFGDLVTISRNSFEVSPQLPLSHLLASTVTHLQYLGSEICEVTNTGNFSDFPFLTLVPFNWNHMLYHDGRGVNLFFPSDEVLHQSLSSRSSNILLPETVKYDYNTSLHKAWLAFKRFAPYNQHPEDFNVFFDIMHRIESGENLHLARYNDGEWVFMLEIEPHYTELLKRHKHQKNEAKSISQKLLRIMDSSPKYYIGIDSTTRALEGFVKPKKELFSEKIRGLNLVWGEIFNAATAQFGMDAIKIPLKNRTVITVGPQYMTKLGLAPTHLSVPETFCWTQEAMIEAQLDVHIRANLDKNPVILYSCAFLAKILIDANYKKYGGKISQLDLGSCIDPWCGVNSREWHKEIINYWNPANPTVIYQTPKPVKKEIPRNLHLGSGAIILPGWENLDKIQHPGVIQADLTTPLTYLDKSIEYIFSRHFLEHLDEVDGYALLQECYRVLKPGGWIRIITPDLKAYLESYSNFRASPSDQGNFSNGVSFINYAMLGEAVSGLKYLDGIKISRNAGHKFIYDFQDLEKKLKNLGFKNISETSSLSSQIPIFDSIGKILDSIGKIPAAREVAVEAQK